MKTIEIRTVEKHLIRNEGVGDYYEDEKGLHILVARQYNDDFDFLIALHELIEFILTRKRSIKEQDIDAYDKQWVIDDNNGLTIAPEPGDEPTNTVYRLEHNIAVDIERLMCRELGYNFDDYNNSLK